MWCFDNTCICQNIHNNKVDQSTVGIGYNTNASIQFKLFLVESPETEKHLKEEKFGIHFKTYYFVHNDQFALNNNATVSKTFSHGSVSDKVGF